MVKFPLIVTCNPNKLLTPAVTASVLVSTIEGANVPLQAGICAESCKLINTNTVQKSLRKLLITRLLEYFTPPLWITLWISEMAYG